MIYKKKQKTTERDKRIAELEGQVKILMQLIKKDKEKDNKNEEVFDFSDDFDEPEEVLVNNKLIVSPQMKVLEQKTSVSPKINKISTGSYR